MHILAAGSIVRTPSTRTLSVAYSDFISSLNYRRELSWHPVLALLASRKQQPPTATPLHRSGGAAALPFLEATRHDDCSDVPLSNPHNGCLRGTRGFATKRQRLDEYDSYEVTVDPKKVPHDFCRVPIHMQSAGELKDTVTVAGRMRLPNPNFWLRCSSAVKDLSEGFRSREIVAILNAYAKAGYRDVSLFGHLGQLLALQAHDCRASDLAVALQAFARLNIPNSSLFDLLAVQCIRKLDDLGPRGIATVASAYGGVKHPHPQLFGRLAQQVEVQAETFCSIDLIQTLWGAVLPVIARAAICFSLTELSAVDSALRSVGLSHDLLTRALQQELQQRGPHLTPLECAEILQDVASRGGDGNDAAAAASVRALLTSPASLASLPEATILQVLKDLKDLDCRGALALAASILYENNYGGHKETLLGGAELLVVQGILLHVFSSAESFVDGYREGFLSKGLRWPDSTPATEEESVSYLGPSCRHDHRSTALSEKARKLYASISATAETVGANALILAVCRYRSDPGVCLWLDLLMKGLIKEADPELLPALLMELARMRKELEAAEEERERVSLDPSYPATPPADPCKHPTLSSAQLSRRFCHVARYLMESPAPGAAAHDVQQYPSSPKSETPHEKFFYGRLSVAAAGSAAKVFRSHPQPEVAQRYVKKLCDLVCSRLQRAKNPAEAGEPGTARNAHLERQVGKSLARLLQSLTALGEEAPPALLQQLAPRLRWLEGRDVLAVLRLLPTPTEPSLRQHITCAVDLRFRDLKSWRRLSQLRDICTGMKLEMDDDVAGFDVDVSRFQAADVGEKDIPTIADAMRDPEGGPLPADVSNFAHQNAKAWV
ncbi:uncharacterized protein EMH_0035670 [Eimeria mitis]|uniref:RNA-editing substrate-binding complex 6 protein domain-containing protein n=1 Tax=Eimeria mitis TaxID=44415 RepID=U6JSY1_9EIME|nr:uncharacterized protein EMH_0035670 [Eimeria mitis]CDJ27871.1 hypothetical protein, conserved [Eimeria mitis]